MKYLELNYPEEYKKIIDDAKKRIPISSNVIEENKPGFYFRRWLAIKVYLINKNNIYKYLKKDKLPFHFDLEYGNKKQINLNTSNGTQKLIDKIYGKIYKNIINDTSWMDNDILFLASSFLKKNIYVFANKTITNIKRGIIGSKFYELQKINFDDNENNGKNSIFLINKDNIHYNTLNKKENKIFKDNFNDFDVVNGYYNFFKN